MSQFADLFAVGHRQTLDFFVSGLREVSEATVDPQELLYNASVLAHYAQTSTATGEGLPTPTSLSALFDEFVVPTEFGYDNETMEAAGAQCLLLAGFFEDQSKKRHNIRWYSQLGAGFFARAARAEAAEPKARLLLTLSDQFEPWRRRHARLARELRLQPYLLQFPKAS